MNVERLVPFGAGAGGTNVFSSETCSSMSLSSSTGRYVPLFRWVSAGRGLAAWSSIVTLVLLTGPDELLLSPPMSDAITAFRVLPGDDTMMSASSIQWSPPASGRVSMSSSDTFTSVTVPVNPDTTIVEG